MAQDRAAASPIWSGDELINKNDWVIDFGSACGSGPTFPDNVRTKLRKFGIALVSGMPVAGKSDVEVSVLLKSYVLKLGCPVSQSAKLDFLGEVTDRGSDISNHQSRGYESAAELPFHSDRCDLLSLLCVRQAPVGGETRVVNAYAAYTALQKKAPELAQVLCQPVPFDLRDTSGGARWAMMPIFSISEGVFLARYVRRFIEASQRFDDAPRITDTQLAAFDAFDAVLESPGMSLDLRLRPGDWLLIDNHRMLHSRTAYRDADEPGQARLLFRSWLCWPGSPELPHCYSATYGRTEAGSLRGGVWPESKPITSLPSDLVQAREALGALIA